MQTSSNLRGRHRVEREGVGKEKGEEIVEWRKGTSSPFSLSRFFMSMWVQKLFKRMISSSNFVARIMTRLVVLVRKDPWSSHLDWHFSELYEDEYGKYKEGKSHRLMPNIFVISFKVGPQGKSQLRIHCVLYLILHGHLSWMPETLWGPWRFVNMMTSYNRRKFHFINKHRIPNQGIVRTIHFSQKRNKLLSQISALSRISAFPWGTKSK